MVELDIDHKQTRIIFYALTLLADTLQEGHNKEILNDCKDMGFGEKDIRDLANTIIMQRDGER
jgi:hypothetical protein